MQIQPIGAATAMTPQVRGAETSQATSSSSGGAAATTASGAASGARGAGGPPPGGGARPASSSQSTESSYYTTLAEQLGITVEQLKHRLAAGESLSDIAKGHQAAAAPASSRHDIATL